MMHDYTIVPVECFAVDNLDVELSFTDDWEDVVAVCADTDGHVFVADRGTNLIYRYHVSGSAGNPDVDEDGFLSWTSQGGGPRFGTWPMQTGTLSC